MRLSTAILMRGVPKPGAALINGAQRDRSMVLVTEGLGPRPFHGRMVLLINEHTHSAAEIVANFAKQNHFFTLVGTRTAGEVLGDANFRLAAG